MKNLIPFTPQGCERPVAMVSPNCSQLVLDVLENSWDKTSSGLGSHTYVDSQSITDADELQEYWEEYSVQLDAKDQILTLSLPSNELGQLLIMSTTMTSPAQQLRQEIEEAGLMDAQTDEFYQELVDYGIESLEQFEDSYQGQYESEADFTEQILDDCYQSDLPSWVCIDYELTWHSALQYDYFSIETGYRRYEIFNKNF